MSGFLLFGVRLRTIQYPNPMTHIRTNVGHGVLDENMEAWIPACAGMTEKATRNRNIFFLLREAEEKKARCRGDSLFGEFFGSGRFSRDEAVGSAPEAARGIGRCVPREGRDLIPRRAGAR
jgi:hypothetical protein